MANILGHLAQLSFAKGNYAKALELQERALEITEQTFGPKHIKIAGCLYELATTHYRLGRLDKAEALHARALFIREKFYQGCSHMEVALRYSFFTLFFVNCTSFHALAYLYTTQGNYDEGEAFYIRSLEILESIFGNEHPEIGTNKNSIKPRLIFFST